MNDPTPSARILAIFTDGQSSPGTSIPITTRQVHDVTPAQVERVIPWMNLCGATMTNGWKQNSTAIFPDITGNTGALADRLEALDQIGLCIISSEEIYGLVGGWDWIDEATLVIDRNTASVGADHASIKGFLTVVNDHEDRFEEKVLITMSDPADWSVKPTMSLLKA